MRGFAIKFIIPGTFLNIIFTSREAAQDHAESMPATGDIYGEHEPKLYKIVPVELIELK
jgi:hypothetical protein